MNMVNFVRAFLSAAPAGRIAPIRHGSLDAGGDLVLTRRRGQPAAQGRKQHMAVGLKVRMSLAFPLLVAAAACVPQDNAPTAAGAVSPAVLPAPVQQPSPAPATKITTDLTVPRSGMGTATYRCGNGGTINIQNLGSSLRVLGPDGAVEEFAASPANQSSRYQEAASHDAIVIDGREALVMKRGSTPQTCKR
jgi:hypothetical protein